MASDLKKKVGRPKKKENKAPEMDLKAIIAVKDEIIADLEAKLDEAYKDEEAMIAEINKNVEMIKYHCSRVKVEAGSVTSEDIEYSVNLLQRIIKHKFEYKPQNWEE